MNSYVITEIDHRGIARIILNNPDKHNAFDDTIISQLTDAFVAVDKNKDVRVVILSSNGKSFSAGADLGWMKRMASYSYEENFRDAQALANMLRILNSLSKPTIARVQGAAFGGAVGLISCCDMAIAAQEASFSLSEVKIGLIPATISPYVIDAIGQRAARRYFQTAERFDAETAMELQLISEVCTIDQLDSVIERVTAHLLTNSPQALAAAKDLIKAVAHKPVTQELVDDTSRRIAEIRVSDEGQAGLTAFLEKRKPNWIE